MRWMRKKLIEMIVNGNEFPVREIPIDYAIGSLQKKIK